MATLQNRADRYLAVVDVPATGNFEPENDGGNAGALAVVLVDGTTGAGVTALGDPTDAPYTDATGAAAGTMISLLKGIYINTHP